jgi:hypothetical protein
VRFVRSIRDPPEIRLAPPVKSTKDLKDRLPSEALSRGPERFNELPFNLTMSPPMETVLLLKRIKGLLLVPELVI